VLGTSLWWRSTVAFTYVKVKSAKCLCLLPAVLVLVVRIWSCLHHCCVRDGKHIIHALQNADGPCSNSSSSLLNPPQRGYVFTLFVCLFVSELTRKLLSRFHKIRQKGGTWQMTERMDFGGIVVSLVFTCYIQNSISLSSSSAKTFVSTGWRIKIYAFVLIHSRPLTVRLHCALFRLSRPLIGPLSLVTPNSLC